MNKTLFDDGNFSIKQYEQKGTDFVSYENAVTGKEFDISFEEAVVFSRVLLSDYLQALEDKITEYMNREHETHKIENNFVELQKDYENLLKEYRAVVKALIKQTNSTNDDD